MLGDILNNGFYTYDYDPLYIEEFLKNFKDKLICVKGNCDREGEIFRITGREEKEYESLKIKNTIFYFTHGHIYNEYNWKKKNTILIFGHTHKAQIKRDENNIYINPGSISKPRGEEDASFGYFDGVNFIIYDINYNVINKIKIIQ